MTREAGVRMLRSVAASAAESLFLSTINNLSQINA